MKTTAGSARAARSANVEGTTGTGGGDSGPSRNALGARAAAEVDADGATAAGGLRRAGARHPARTATTPSTLARRPTPRANAAKGARRSEEHTSELQSQF